MHLAMDARMVSHSGIGRYIRYLIPLILKKQNVRLTLLGNKKELTKLFPGVSVIETRAGIYSPLEQLEYFLKVPACDVFWSPHYNAPLIATRAKITVTTIHDLFPYSPFAARSGMGFFKRSYARLLLKNAVVRSDRVIAVSEATRAEIAAKIGPGGNTAKKTSVIHHFIDPVFHKTKTGSKLPVEGRFILYVGNVKPHKNILGILGAFAIAAEKDAGLKLVIAGKKDGFITGMKGWEGLLARLGIGKKVVFTGVLPDPDLVALYSSARALVFPSFYEGFGYPPLEAMACGCPVVVSDIPPLRETCGSAAVYVDPASERNIADGIGQALEKGAREKLAAKGFRNLKRFEKKTIYRKYELFLDSLMRTES